MTDKRVFGCPNCGEKYEAYPPDDRHPIASIEKPSSSDVEGSVIEVNNKCGTCGSSFKLYWYSEKIPFAAFNL